MEKEQLEDRLREILIEARQIEEQLFHLSSEKKARDREVRNQDLCVCGHNRKTHGKARSIDFTAGPCGACKPCMDFMMK